MTKKTTKKKGQTRVNKRTKAEIMARVIAAQDEMESTKWPWPLRPYQQKAINEFDKGKRRQVLIWHRRAGKDVFCLSLARRESQQRIGGYVHFFPKHIQAKRAIWQGVDPKRGARFIDTAFGDIEADRNNTEMFIEMANGSTWQLLGSDNYDRVVGSNAVGVVFSEWALCDPRAWDFIRPIILENNGWAIFITTYRGRNHAWQMVQNLKDNPNWFVDVRSIEQTQDIDGNPILTQKDMEEELKSGMSPGMLQQEYYCNPEAIADGSIYGKQVEQLRKDTSRHHAEWTPGKPVYCVWYLDLPMTANCITVQKGKVLDSWTLENTTLAEAVAKSEQARWPVQRHILLPDQRDLMVRFQDLDRNPEVLSNFNQLVATTAAQDFLARCHINLDKCELLMEALAGYVRRERFDSQTAVVEFSERPAETWHTRLAKCLELWAVWEYHGQDSWTSTPDYRIQDRIARTIL